MINNAWAEEKINDIREIFAPKLTDAEFDFFKNLGISTGLNPFRNEIWAVKYGSQAAQIFIGRDGYRAIALKQNDYDYHQCDCVRENDSFEVIKGEVNHTYNLKNRGKIMGAYCITKRKSSSKPVYHFVEFSEYNTGKSLWSSKPETMIKKVAEAHALRASFHDILGGTYIPEEVPEEMSQIQLHEHYEEAPEEMSEIQFDKSSEQIKLRASSEQINMINTLIADKNIDNERIKKALGYYKVDKIDNLLEEQANTVIERFRR